MKLICIVLIALSLTACTKHTTKGEVYVVLVDGKPQYVTVLKPKFTSALVRYHADGKMGVVEDHLIYRVGDIFPDKEK